MVARRAARAAGGARGSRGRSAKSAAVISGATDPDGAAAAAPTDAGGASGPAAKIPAAERRAAALALVAIWRDVARDLALVGLGQPGDVRQLDLLDDLEAAAARLRATFAVDQLRRLELAGERLEGNVSPELVVDGLALGWTA